MIQNIVIGILTVVLAVLGIGAFFMNVENKKLQKEMNKKEAENAKQNKSKNKVKESLDTGNNDTDFITSLNVVHDLADYD